jgi:hypothetical protein
MYALPLDSLELQRTKKSPKTLVVVICVALQRQCLFQVCRIFGFALRCRGKFGLKR